MILSGLFDPQMRRVRSIKSWVTRRCPSRSRHRRIGTSASSTTTRVTALLSRWWLSWYTLFLHWCSSQASWFTLWWLIWTPSPVSRWIPTDSIWCLAVSVLHTNINHKPWKHQLTVIVSQVTTAPCVCGTWRARRASRSSPPTGRSSTSPFTTWRFTPPSATSAAREPTPSPKSSYDLRPPTKTASTNSKPEREARADDPGGPGAGGEAPRDASVPPPNTSSVQPHRKLGASHTSVVLLIFFFSPFVVSLLTWAWVCHSFWFLSFF